MSYELRASSLPRPKKILKKIKQSNANPEN